MKRTSNTPKSSIGILFLILLSFGLNCKTVAQSVEEINARTLSISMSAVELVPADLIVFSININAEAKTPKEAFDLHKARETKLAELLKTFEIDEEDIRFQPIRMNRRTNYNNRNNPVTTVATNQQVSVSFSNFGIYEKIQMALIDADFDSFSGSFSSTKTEMGKEKALEAAIQSAKERAQFIANQSGVKLGAIKTISYSEYQVNYPPMAREDFAMARSAAPSLMDFDQTVSVTANISIIFSIN